MDDRPPVPPTPNEPAPESYEPPAVEDLDSTYGPSVTAAGGTLPPAAPRDL